MRLTMRHMFVPKTLRAGILQPENSAPPRTFTLSHQRHSLTLTVFRFLWYTGEYKF